MIQEFPLFIFTLLGGAAGCSYVFAALFPLEKPQRTRKVALPLVALILLAVSGLTLLTHLGHPERMFNAFGNPSAGITQEGVVMICFGVIVLVDFVMCAVNDRDIRWLKIVGGVFGLLLSCVMANAYFQMLGKPCASNPVVVPMFIFGNLATGAALYSLFMARPFDKSAFKWSDFVVTVIAALTFCALVPVFEANQLSVAPFVIATIVVLAGAVCMLIAGKCEKFDFTVVVCALVFIGVMVARFAFYSVI